MKLEIEVVNLRQFEREFAANPEAATEAARIALNKGATFLARESSKEIRKTLAFNPKELWSAANPVRGKISTLFASNRTLEARVQGADRPTLLSRFSPDNPATGASWRPGKTLRVRVAPSVMKTLKRAFFVAFENGAYGLAVRLRNGERLLNHRGKTYPLRGDPNVQILYAPSVDQALSTAAPDKIDEAGRIVTDEFLRQYDRLTKNG